MIIRACFRYFFWLLGLCSAVSHAADAECIPVMDQADFNKTVPSIEQVRKVN